MIKASDEAAGAARTAYMLYGWFLKEVASEVGWDKALELHGRAGIHFGEMLAGVLRARAGNKPLDAGMVGEVLDSAYKSFGIDYEIETTADRVEGRYYRCPIYEGLKAAGLDHAMIDRACGAMSETEYEKLRQAIPELSARGHMRETAEGHCTEELVLAK